MPRTLDPAKAERLVELVNKLGKTASFRYLMTEAARSGVLTRHETLRKYLDLLLAGRVLRVRTRDVGSVRLQQLYGVMSSTPRIWVGLAALRTYGLNWDVDETEIRPVSTDFEGLARSRVLHGKAIASLEDCLVHELHAEATKQTGGIHLIAGMVSTKALDLPYMLRRANRMRVGAAVRLLYKRILQFVSKKETNVPASVFIAVRNQFLRIARQYSRTGYWKLLDEKGTGNLSLQVVRNLSEHEALMAAGKQLGVTG